MTHNSFRVLVTVFAALVGGINAASAQTWTPPIGIPAPSFGITQVAPAAPNPWTDAVAGFYYVCANCSNATDTGNPYGTPTKPRATIPNSLPAGAVVELRGTYSRNHSSPNGIVFNGTSSSPIFIRGASETDRPTLTGNWEVSGTYAIMENLYFQPSDNLAILAPASRVALRKSELRGTPSAGGIIVASWNGKTLDNIVIYGNKIHDNGDVDASYDQDKHGIAVAANVSYLWVVDNELYRNSGDGIQINAGSASSQPTLHHVYVGRNVSHHNKQTGFWTKQAVDVIFSQNTSYGHRASGSSSGDGMGGQYAPSNVWFLFNRIYDNESGIRIASDSDLGTGTDVFVVGNLIYNIHKVASAYNANTGYELGAVTLWGSTNSYVVNNTIWDIDAGITSPRSNGKVAVYDNIIGTASKSGASQIFFESSTLANNSMVDYNVFQGSSSIRWGSSTVRTVVNTGITGIGTHNVATSSSPFVDVQSGNYSLSSSSPAVNAGVDVDTTSANVYSMFKARYGIDIKKDFTGTTRPQSVFDMGAYEYGGVTVPAPLPPSSLSVN